MNVPLQKLDREQLLADLLWDYGYRVRRGDAVSMSAYLDRCTDEEMQTEFLELANISALIDLVMDLELDGL